MEAAIQETSPADRFGRLIREHQAMVFSMALAYTRNRATAEDIAQEVFLELHRKLNTLETEAHVMHWLRRVTAHRLIDYSRKQQRHPQASIDDLPELSFAAPQSDPLLGDVLRQLIASLPERPRMVMILRFQEDLDPVDISEALDMPLATVKSHLQRSLALLRDKLSRRYGDIQYELK